MTETWLLALATTPGIRANPALGVSEEEIAAAEAELGVTLPPSYRAWLRAYNDTLIAGGEIFGLAPPESADIADTDIRYRRRLGEPWEQRLTFYAPNDDEWWEFDFTRPTSGGEVMILAHDRLGGGESAEDYADSFSGFLTRLLTETRASSTR